MTVPRPSWLAYLPIYCTLQGRDGPVGEKNPACTCREASLEIGAYRILQILPGNTASQFKELVSWHSQQESDASRSHTSTSMGAFRWGDTEWKCGDLLHGKKCSKVCIVKGAVFVYKWWCQRKWGKVRNVERSAIRNWGDVSEVMCSGARWTEVKLG